MNASERAAKIEEAARAHLKATSHWKLTANVEEAARALKTALALPVEEAGTTCDCVHAFATGVCSCCGATNGQPCKHPPSPPATPAPAGDPDGPWEWGAVMAYRETGVDFGAAIGRAKWLKTQLHRSDAPSIWASSPPAPSSGTTHRDDGPAPCDHRNSAWLGMGRERQRCFDCGMLWINDGQGWRRGAESKESGT